MVDRRAPAPRFIILLLLLVLLSAFLGGIVARLVPGGQTDPGPRVLAGPADDSLAPLVRKTSPAVVNIAVLQPSPAEQNPLLQDPYFRRYFGVPDAALQPAMAAGSGVIVDGAKGFVITNFHVVRNAEAIEVTLKDGRKYRAQPLGVAPNLDLAVLKIDAGNLPTLPLGDSRKLEVGDYVVAIGNPFGLGQTVTNGIVSATERPLGAGGPASFHSDRCADQSGQFGRRADQPARRAHRNQLGPVQPQRERERRRQCGHRLCNPQQCREAGAGCG